MPIRGKHPRGAEESPQPIKHEAIGPRPGYGVSNTWSGLRQAEEEAQDYAPHPDYDY